MAAVDHPVAAADRTGDEVLVRTCGAVQVEGPTRSVTVRGRQPQVVLAHLALEGGRSSRDRLAEVVWGEVLSEHWPGALRGIVSKVRGALVESGLPPEAIRIDGGTVHLEPPDGLVADVDLAAALVADAETGLAAGRPGAALDDALAARATTTLPFLEHHDDDWSRHQRRHLADLTQRAVHAQLAALLALGRHEDAAARARERLVDEPLDERAHHLLVEALLAGGRRGAAAQALEDLRRTLRDELGIDPAPATAALLDAPTPTAPRSDRPAREGAAPRSGRSARPAVGDRRTQDFVGRHAEVAELDERWAAVVAAAEPQVVVLEGPPGAGKTRLAERFAEQRVAAGDRVLWGRGRADAGLAYGPFAEALDGALRDEPALLDDLGSRGAALAALLPHLDAPGGYRRPEDDGLARTHLFGAVTAAVEQLAARPCLLVLDDLQWAGPDAMALLEVALDGLRAPLLVLASTLPTGGSQARALASLQRVVEVATIRLGGLRPEALAELLVGHRLAPGADPEAVATRLHRRTAGLPFYVAELTRDADRGRGPVDPDAVPASARAWVSRRTAGLADADRYLLEVAAVLDEPVAPELVAADPGATIELRPLVDEGLVQVHDDGTISLAHDLTRQAVYDDIDPHRRARLHHGAAELLEGIDARGRPRHRPDHATLAHHRRRAGAADRPLAARHALAAGLEALDQGAWDRAADHLVHALDEDPPPVERARTLVAAGRAAHLLGDHERARGHLEEALALARRHHLVDDQAEATVALVGRAGRGAAIGAADARQVELLRRAVADLEGAPPPEDAEAARRRAVLACRLDTELAMALLLSDAAIERVELLERARRRARALDPPSPSATAWTLLAGRYALLGPDGLGRRLADLDEVLALPAEQLPPEALLAARCYRHEDLLRSGRADEATAALVAAAAAVEAHPVPYWSWAVHTWEGLSANLAGDLDRAEAIAVDAATRRPDIPEAQACLGVNLVGIRALQGRAGEVLDLLAAAVDQTPSVPCYRAVLALCATEAGDLDLAERSYRWFADDGFAPLPEDTSRFLGLGVLAHTAVELDDAEGATRLTDLLTPYRGQWILLSCYGGGGAHWGPTSHQLARLASLCGRRDDAAALFAEAEDQAEAMGAPLVAERIRADAGRLLATAAS